MGHLLRLPKYFLADFLPIYESTASSMMTSLTINLILFMLIFSTWSRRKSRVCDFLFLSQNRKEDRPDTLNFQVTEDLMRFAVYFPFKVFIANDIGNKACIFIPILINTVGDGLAEPIGVKYGKHKYKTKALYYKGKWWSGNFVRSLEGSACVFFVSVFVVAANYNGFRSLGQFLFSFIFIPPLMTLAEAFAPHTNDGPFLGLVGCGLLAFAFYVIP